MTADATGVAGQRHALVQLFQATGIPST